MRYKMGLRQKGSTYKRIPPNITSDNGFVNSGGVGIVYQYKQHNISIKYGEVTTFFYIISV